MLHNKIVGWGTFLEVVERMNKMSPWLSRQIQQRVAEWPFIFSGLHVKDWQDGRAHVHLPKSVRNSLDGEICQGHLLLGAEMALRLVLLRYRHEFPFRFSIRGSRLEMHHPIDQAVDFRFAVEFAEWEKLRLELARGFTSEMTFVVPAFLADGRSALLAELQVRFQLEKFLPA
ncbi:MAG: hypothetical protein AB7F86_07955 [Bdellovibrionales bacterium]